VAVLLKEDYQMFSLSPEDKKQMGLNCRRIQLVYLRLLYLPRSGQCARIIKHGLVMLGVVVGNFNPSTLETKARGMTWRPVWVTQ
jgi:hypothetical protein